MNAKKARGSLSEDRRRPVTLDLHANFPLRTILQNRRYTNVSELLLAMGEPARRALRSAGVEIVTLGQYLRPTAKHVAVERYVSPEEFELWKSEALAMGFKYVASAPLVRSSYLADQAVEACGL